MPFPSVTNPFESHNEHVNVLSCLYNVHYVQLRPLQCYINKDMQETYNNGIADFPEWSWNIVVMGQEMCWQVFWFTVCFSSLFFHVAFDSKLAFLGCGLLFHRNPMCLNQCWQKSWMHCCIIQMVTIMEISTIYNRNNLALIRKSKDYVYGI